VNSRQGKNTEVVGWWVGKQRTKNRVKRSRAEKEWREGVFFSSGYDWRPTTFYMDISTPTTFTVSSKF
jgi:hypothetical protein